MGAGHLPDAGGYLDQSVRLMDALNMMAAFEQALEENDGLFLQEDGTVDGRAKEKAAIATWMRGVHQR